MMRIAIMGCGAMGSIYAALLADAGHDVLIVDRWKEHIGTIMRSGLRVEGASGDRLIRLQAFTEPPETVVDLIVIAVKAAQVERAVIDAQRMIGKATVVVTIQNGLGSADAAATHVDPDRLIVGIAGGFGATLKTAGHAYHNGMQIIRMGPYAGLAHAEIEEIALVWSAAGFRTEAVRDITTMQWEKLICNVAYSAPCALTGMTVGQAVDDPDIGSVSRAAAVEAWQTALARGVPISVEEPIAYVREFAARMPDAKPSLLLDHESGRPSEIDFINGAIPREAAKAGKKAPVNETLTGLVRLKERSFPPRRSTGIGPAKGCHNA